MKKNYTASSIVEKIQQKLSEKNSTQKDMIAYTQLSHNTYNAMKVRGSFPRSDNLAKIADYLGVSTDYLLGRTLSSNIELSNKDNINFNNEYDKETATIIKNLMLLDDIDKGKISERIKIMLEDDKYSSKKELLNA